MTYKKYITSAILSAFIATASFAENTLNSPPSRQFCNLPNDVESCLLIEAAQSAYERQPSFVLPATYMSYLARRGNVEATAKFKQDFQNNLPSDEVKDAFSFFHYLAQIYKEPHYETVQKAMSLDLYVVGNVFSENAPLYIYEVLLDYDEKQAEKFFDEYIWPLLLEKKINPFVYMRFLQEKAATEKLEQWKTYISAHLGNHADYAVQTHLSVCNVSQAFNSWKKLPKDKKIGFQLQISEALIQKQEFDKAFRILKASPLYKEEIRLPSDGILFLSVFLPIIDELSYHPDTFKKTAQFVKKINLSEYYAKALYKQGHKDMAASLSFADKEDVLKAEEIHSLINEKQYEKADEELKKIVINGKLTEDMPLIYLDVIIRISLVENNIAHKYREAIYNFPFKNNALYFFARYKAHDYAAMAIDNTIKSLEAGEKLGAIPYITSSETKNVISSALFEYITRTESHTNPASWDFSRFRFEYNANYCRDKVH